MERCAVIKGITIATDSACRWVCVGYMAWEPPMIELGKGHPVVCQGGMMMHFIIVSGENLSLYLSGKILDWPLSPIFRHYKYKRPPPIAT